MNKAKTEKFRKIAEAGVTPLEYMLSILQDENAEPEKRFDAAKSAAPYVHPRLTQASVSVSNEDDVRAMDDAELIDALLDEIEAMKMQREQEALMAAQSARQDTNGATQH